MAINHVQEYGKPAVLSKIYQEIQDVYLSDSRPWVIGYSGGKDSTLTAMTVFEALRLLPEEKRTKEVHVVSSDTMVENPLIINYLNQNMLMMNQFSKGTHLPIISKMVRPKRNETFWSLLLGKGYPSPRQTFRWCTHRLKIKPIDEYIDKVADQSGSVIVVLGVRNAESNTRQNSIAKHTIDGKILKTHNTNLRAFTYAPIEHLSNDDVWACLLNTVSPWGFDNNLLLSLYRDASDESECPIQQDVNTPSCGQSRFGCWTCTVVSKDKSLSGFIQNDYDELRPLLRFRNYLTEIRDDVTYRSNHRMDGSIYYVGSEKDRRGLGPFSLEGRIKLTTELLQTEVQFNHALMNSSANQFTIDRDTYYELISRDELQIIRKQWIEDGDWEDTLPVLYEKITGKPFYSGYVNQPFISRSDYSALKTICEEDHVDLDLIKSLITLENKYLGIKQRNDIYNKIGKLLNRDIVHEELHEIHRRNNNETDTDHN